MGKEYFELFALIIGLSFTSNILLGYILDIFLNISWYSHLSSLLVLGFITIYYRKEFFLKPRDKLKFIIKNFIYQGGKLLKSIHFYIFFIILILYFLNIFNYSFYYFSVSTTDPTVIMKIISHSLFTEKITYNEYYIGILQLEDRHYPVGFYIVLCFLSCYDPTNLFIIIKFFGPFINLLSLTYMYFISTKITKNKTAGLIAMLTYISSTFINDFSVLTLASGTGILLFFISLSFLIEKSITSSRISGIILGGAFLVHPFTGAIFYIPGICIYFITRYIQKKERNILYFFLTMLIVLIPYLLLFTYPGFNSKLDDGINSMSQASSLTYGFDLLQRGPNLIFWFIILFSLFSFYQNKNELLLFLSLLIISLIFMLNPFYINGIPLKNIFDQFYNHRRGLFFFSIACAYLSSLGIIGLQNLFKFFKQKYYQFLKGYSIKFRKYNLGIVGLQNLNKIFKYKNFKLYRIISLKFKNKLLIIDFLIIPLIISQIITTNNHLFTGYGFFNPNKVPEEYTEVLLWINENINKGSSIIVQNNTFNTNNEPLIIAYHNALAFQYEFERNNTYFQIFNFTYSYLEQIGFFNYDYIIIPKDYVQHYNNIIANQSIILKFNSYLNSYFLYKISKNLI